MKTLDTTGIEELFIETPVKKSGRAKIPVKAKNTFENVSSFRLAGELFKRHYVDLQVLGFWLVLAAFVWVKLG